MRVRIDVVLVAALPVIAACSGRLALDQDVPRTDDGVDDGRSSRDARGGVKDVSPGPAGARTGSTGAVSMSGDTESTSPAADAASNSAEPTADVAVSAPPQPLRRLSHFEYRNTLADLFPMLTVVVPELAVDERIDGFTNHYDGMQPSDLLTEQYLGVAQAVARQVDESVVQRWGGCVRGGSCSETFIRGFGAEAFRRPLTDEEIARYLDIFESGPGGLDPLLGMQLTVMTMLQSPHFLYRPELGVAADPGPLGKPLSPYETASRLSYLFWASMPDDELFDAASAGELVDAESVRVQAERLLQDDKARRGVIQFLREWLKLDKVTTKLKLDEAGWDEAFRDELRQSVERFVYDEVFVPGGTSVDLLTSTRFPATAAIAGLFGETSNGGSWSVIQTDAEQRSGLLTHPAFLGAHGYGEYGSPVLRGVYVLDRILCAPPSPPPPGTVVMPPESPSDAAQPRTNREAYVEATAGPGCDACHTAINALGFAFEHYDTLGQYRDTDSGHPVDASGALGQFQFEDAVELSQQLAASEEFQACVVRRWASYALGGSPLAADPAFLDDLRGAFSSEGHSLRELLMSIATHERFAHWLAVEQTH